MDGVRKVNRDTLLLNFRSWRIARDSRPGQFVHIKIQPALLRRPFSINKVTGDDVYILFKVRGRGTEALAGRVKGDTLDVIGPLGRGFDYPQSGVSGRNIFVAEGMGVAPLVFLARFLSGKGRNKALLGARTAREIVCRGEFRKAKANLGLATEDGSLGIKGTAVDLLAEELRAAGREKVNIYACGPKDMLFAIHKLIRRNPRVNCQVSFEQFMGCGLGLCCGCAIQTRRGYKKVCREGPVFDIREIW